MLSAACKYEKCDGGECALALSSAPLNYWTYKLFMEELFNVSLRNLFFFSYNDMIRLVGVIF